jgi:transposase, IS30 family
LKKYSRVSYEVRCQIYALLETKISVPGIAKRLGYNKSSIYREIKRNSYWRGYRPHLANQLAVKRFKSCKRKTKISGSIEKIVQSGLKEGWSPEQVAGRIRFEKITNLSHETVYRYTRLNPEYQRFLRWHNRRGYGRYRQRLKRPSWMVSIKHRPAIVDRRSRVGDWERDTMYVKDRKTILVLTERKTRYTILSKLESHNANEVAAKTSCLLKETGKKIFTVTNDNGGEFRSKSKEPYNVYWCEPHKPQQRGTVENTIGTLRRYLKRDTDIDSINIEWMTKILNLKPRKVLDYQTPYEVFYNKKVALAV